MNISRRETLRRCLAFCALAGAGPLAIASVAAQPQPQVFRTWVANLYRGGRLIGYRSGIVIPMRGGGIVDGLRRLATFIRENCNSISPDDSFTFDLVMECKVLGEWMQIASFPPPSLDNPFLTRVGDLLATYPASSLNSQL